MKKIKSSKSKNKKVVIIYYDFLESGDCVYEIKGSELEVYV